MASTLFSNLSNKVKQWFSFNDPETKTGEERSGSNGNINISNETRDPFHFAEMYTRVSNQKVPISVKLRLLTSTYLRIMWKTTRLMLLVLDIADEKTTGFFTWD